MSTENCDNKCFGTIRNNTALKHDVTVNSIEMGFGTIRNNTALKLRVEYEDEDGGFWNHSKQHSSKTQLLTDLKL